MDRSLWLLLRLRAWAWLRRRWDGVRTLKGVLLAAVGSVLLLPFVLSFFLAPRVMIDAQVGAIRRYGPLGLLAYCVLNVLLSAGDRSVYYAPEEVDFLFCGPYRPRQLLLYKVAGGTAGATVTALLLTLALGHHTTAPLPAYVGLLLALELLYLFSMAVGLAASAFGALAYDRARRAVAAAVGLAVAWAAWGVGRGLVSLPFGEVVARAERSPVVRVVLAPFRPFVMAFTADRAWPDLAAWSSLAALVDVAMLVLVLVLNAGFLEASAASSARAYERLRRVRRGGAWGGGGKARFGLPMPPWWGGVGPTAWRQLTSLSRTPLQLAGLAVMFGMPVVLLAVSPGAGAGAPAAVVPAVVMLAGVALFSPSTVGFDFRHDVNRIEALKTLPVRPGRLVVGQLLTPLLVLSVAGWAALAGMAAVSGVVRDYAPPAAALVVPVNFLLLAVENLYALWFPSDTRGVTSIDFQAVGRQTLLLAAKGAVVGSAGALAAGAGAAAYFATGGGVGATVAASSAVVGACGLALVPPLARAFERFDVAQDTPD